MNVRLPQPLTAVQKKAAIHEIDLQIADQMKFLNTDLCSMFLYFLHEYCGHGKKRLEDDWRHFQPLLDKLIERYQFDEFDKPWICQKKLSDIGINCEELAKEQKPILSYKVSDTKW